MRGASITAGCRGSGRAGSTAGFSLVELMVALALGLVLTGGMTYVYLSGRAAIARQQQLSSLQQGVRTAFEHLGADIRAAGHMGCFTGTPKVSGNFTNTLTANEAATLDTHYAVGIEGYEYINPAEGAFTLASNRLTPISEVKSWRNNRDPAGIATLPLNAIAGVASGLAPGSDVLVIRGASGRPLRLAADANVGAGQNKLSIETLIRAADFCTDGRTPKVSGLCVGSHALVANCKRARVFRVGAITPGAANAPSALELMSGTTLDLDPTYARDETEVFALQTVVFYVRTALSGTTTSLYRRVFDGAHEGGIEQELVEGVENMQLTYGVDTTPEQDGVADVYVTASGPLGTGQDSVTEWSRVVSVRIGLLMRAANPLDRDLAPAAIPPVNGVTIGLPDTGATYDRRVFTTTVALRNNIAY